nr:protein-tyrosine sulfotransferase 2-like isoform X2 [Procambarus clarkii]
MDDINDEQRKLENQSSPILLMFVTGKTVRRVVKLVVLLVVLGVWFTPFFSPTTTVPAVHHHRNLHHYHHHHHHHHYQRASEGAASTTQLPASPPTPLSPLVVVSGLPGAGTGLLRAVLDAHPQVKCWEGSGVLHTLARMWRSLTASARERHRLQLAGISETVLKEATQLFLLEVLANNVSSVSIACMRDALALTGGRYLLTAFPNTKFIFLVRDPRAAATSLWRRQVPLLGRGLRSVEEGLRMLEDLLGVLRTECLLMGPRRCLPVHYEALVLNPRKTMGKVMRFIGGNLNKDMIHHHHAIGSFTPSTDTLTGLKTDSLTAWVAHFPGYLRLSPRYYYGQAKFLGYDLRSFPPNYLRLGPYDWSSPRPWRPSRDSEEFLRMVGKMAAKASGEPVHDDAQVGRHLRAFLYV